MFITNLHIFPFEINIVVENVYQYHYFVYMKQNKKSNENIEVLFLIYIFNTNIDIKGKNMHICNKHYLFSKMLFTDSVWLNE